MRSVDLMLKRGIDRLRKRGGAKAEWLYDLENAYLTAARTVLPRPGTYREANLPAASQYEPGTVGLVAFNGKLHVFASGSVDLSGFPDFQLNILLHPSDSEAALEKIHFAAPFQGALYVVAEFDDGSIYHYWLQDADEWEAETEYAANEFVTPTTPNGFVYRAVRFGNPYPAWSSGVLRTAGNGSSIEPSRIEPTIYNEYYYEAVDTTGDNPRSGLIEPDWPTHTGEQIIENTDGFDVNPPDEANPPDPPAPNKPQGFSSSKYFR